MAILYKQLHNQQTELTDEYESIIHVSTTAHNNADLFTHGARFRSLWRAPKVYCAKKMTKRFGISTYVRMKKNLKKTRIKLYNTLALPVLLYGSETWDY